MATPPIVLVIDPNPAVQAIASLALSQIGVTVKTLASGKNALEQIRKVRPAVILCSKDVPGLDPFTLCKELKSVAGRGKNSEPTPAFVLMAPGDTVQSLLASAESARINEILAKPFKSDELRAVVQRLLSTLPQEGGVQALIVTKDSLLEKLFAKLLKNRRTTLQLCSSAEEAAIQLKQHEFALTVLDHASVNDFSWCESKRLGRVLVITTPTAQKLPAGLAAVSRPLNYAKLEDVFSQVLPEEQMPQKKAAAGLNLTAQAKLAAKISAGVFERLIEGQALRSGSWDEVGALVQEETVKICKTFARKSSG